MRPIIAIVGRPNVGKSTLFNRLVGGRVALVEDVPGVTRDRHYANGDWAGKALAFVDTGGFVPAGHAGAFEPGRKGDEKKKAVGGGVGGRLPSHLEDQELLASIRAQAQLAIDEAAAIIFVCDAMEGLVTSDEVVCQLLRKSGKPVFVVANKVDSEKREREAGIPEFYKLGVEHVFQVSAEHGRGISELMDAVVAVVPNAPSMADEPEEAKETVIRLAVVGRPNVGKSTLLNAIMGGERFISSPVPGTTHDALDETFEYKGRKFILTDTAGIRRRKSISARVESFSVVRALDAIEECDVAAVLVDPTEMGVDQDKAIVGIAEGQGRSVIMVVNKWDTVENDEKAAEKKREELKEAINFVPFAPVVFVSALNGLRVNKVLDLAIHLHDQAMRRIPTPELNRWLQVVQDSNPAPLWRGFPVKFFYAAQVSVRPITIAVQTNRPQAVGDQYRRYMMNKFRETFGVEVPVRMTFKQKQGNRRPPRKRDEK